jgi:hypothetical protein
LVEITIGFVAHPAGTGLIREGWECDGWRVVLSGANKGNKNVESFDYFTGTGNRVITNPEKYEQLSAELKKYNPRCTAAESIRKQMEHYTNPFAPCSASVLYSLILDSSADDESFSKWRDDYGYDSDSIKALNIYSACCENAKKLHKIFTREQIRHLQDLLQDY